MRYLVLSDLHGNWEALQAVVDSASGQYDRILCCGDLIGYGADPNRVLEWAREHVFASVRGNHDRACVGLEDLDWFNPVAQAASRWTHEILKPENVEYVRNLPQGPVDIENFQILHGSPVHEDEYLVNAADAQNAFAYIGAPVVFFGHTHLQGGFEWCRSGIQALPKPQPMLQSEVEVTMDPDCAYLVNPGSVGQPRDGDARASYVLYRPADRILSYRRVDYDVATAQNKIIRAGLPELLATRLAWGR